jgi:hypothetical protein
MAGSGGREWDLWIHRARRPDSSPRHATTRAASDCLGIDCASFRRGILITLDFLRNILLTLISWRLYRRHSVNNDKANVANNRKKSV